MQTKLQIPMYAIIFVSLFLTNTKSFGIDFSDPNTSYFSVEQFAYFDNTGGLKHYNVAGYYARQKGDIPPKISVLPTISVDHKNIRIINKEGQSVYPSNIGNGESIRVVQIPLLYHGALPNDSEGAAVAAQVSGSTLNVFYPDPLVDNFGNPFIYQPARFGQLAPMIIQDANAYQQMLDEKQKPFEDLWSKIQSEVASIDSLEIRLVIDGDILASRVLPGSAILASGKLPRLNIKTPSLEMLNRVIEGTYEVEVSYSFRDAKVSSIVANYDFSVFMSNYIKESRKVVTKSKSSGTSFFVFSNRRSSIRQFVNESAEQNSSMDTRTRTIIDIVDADDQMVAQFESQFFPTLSKQKTVNNHLAASARAKKDGNDDLAKVHMDYAKALQNNDKSSEIDVVGAAAALSSGNYAMFIAKGVRFSSNDGSQSSSFSRIVSATVREGDHKQWVSSNTRSVRRKVTVLLNPEEEQTFRSWMGLIKGHPYNSSLGFQPHTFFVPTLIVAGSPLHKAGVLPGMMIAFIDSQQIRTIDDLENIVEYRSPGDEIHLDVLDPKNPNHTFRIKVELAAGLPMPN